jgi:hypothetical protein
MPKLPRRSSAAKQNLEVVSSPRKKPNLSEAFSAQARLLARRAELGLAIDLRSLESLVSLGEILELTRMAA